MQLLDQKVVKTNSNVRGVRFIVWCLHGPHLEWVNLSSIVGTSNKNSHKLWKNWSPNPEHMHQKKWPKEMTTVKCGYLQKKDLCHPSQGKKHISCKHAFTLYIQGCGPCFPCNQYPAIVLMEEILHQLIGSLHHHLKGKGLYLPGGAGFLPSPVNIPSLKQTFSQREHGRWERILSSWVPAYF